MTYAIAHFAMSFPGDTPMGWSPEFPGFDHADDYAEFVIVTTRRLKGKDVLLRGYSGTAPRDEKWVVGETEQARDIHSGVRCSAWLDTASLLQRRHMVGKLKAAGLRVWVHDGPATTRREALLSARILADDGVYAAAIDSSGRNTSETVMLQLEAIHAFGVMALTEPDGHPDYPALANIERFVLPAIERGDDVSDVIAWVNDPSDEARARWPQMVAECLKDPRNKVMGTCVPHRLMRNTTQEAQHGDPK